MQTMPEVWAPHRFLAEKLVGYALTHHYESSRMQQSKRCVRGTAARHLSRCTALQGGGGCSGCCRA